ncbi:MAG: hypothetical protein HFJ52_08325 [Clostridia bacterium]|nr:hypothetical protein [Clostridia bacterium]
MIDTAPNGDVLLKFYDENQSLIAARGADGEIYPSEAFINEDLSFLNEIDDFSIDESLSLEELDQELEEVARVLGVSKSDVLSMSQVELDAVIGEKDVDSLSLEDNKKLSKEEQSNRNDRNAEALQNMNTRQEINLDKKIDNKLTLAEVLGVPAGSVLCVVDTDKIQDSENTTRYSCVIKAPDGSVQMADMLKQVGGKHSSKDVYETNRDGSKVEKQVIQSSFEIDSPLVKNGIINIRKGQMGVTEVSYGQMDRTSHNDVFAQKLETRETYPVTREVRNEFSGYKGIDNVSNKMDEIKEHENHGCKNMSLREADGNPDTGHIHGLSENAAEIILADEHVGEKIDSIYTSNEVAERFERMCEKYPDKNFDEVIELTKNELSEEADHMHGMERSH